MVNIDGDMTLFQVPIRLHDKIKETRDPVVGLDHVKVYTSLILDKQKSCCIFWFSLKPLEFTQVVFPEILKKTHKYVGALVQE